MFTTPLHSTTAIYYAKASLGLEGSGDAYVSSYLKSDLIPTGVSLDCISKTAGKIEEMAKGKVNAPKKRNKRNFFI